MNCSDTLEQLSPYLDGALSQVEMVRVEQHLRRCGACAGQVQVLRQIQTLLGDLPQVEVPVEFHSRLMQRISTLPVAAAHSRPMLTGTGADTVKASRMWRRVAGWALPAAAAAALAGATWLPLQVAGPEVLSAPIVVASPGAMAGVEAPTAGADSEVNSPVVAPAPEVTGQTPGLSDGQPPVSPEKPDVTAPRANNTGGAADRAVVTGAPTGPAPGGSGPAAAAQPPEVAAAPRATGANSNPSLPSSGLLGGNSAVARAASEYTIPPITVRSTGKVERSAEVTLAVADLQDGQRALTAAAVAAGGQVETVRAEASRVSVLVRIPAGDLGRILKSLDRIGTLAAQPVVRAEDRNAEWDLVTSRLQAQRSELDHWRRTADSQGMSTHVSLQIQQVLSEIANLEATLQVLGTRLGTAEVSILLQEGSA